MKKLILFIFILIISSVPVHARNTEEIYEPFEEATDLCNEFWDDIVSLMDFRVIEKIANPKARLSRVDAVRAYCREDQDFWDVLGCKTKAEAGFTYPAFFRPVLQ